MRRLWQVSIWHPDGIAPDEYKWRNALRVWLPFYDALVLGAGIWAALFGSPLLRRLFPEDLIDVAGIGMAAAALVCFVGLAFPHLWPVELAGKLVLIFLLGAYAGTVMVFPTNPDASNGFVVFILVMAIVAPLMRVNVLADDVTAAWLRWRAAKRKRAT